MPAWLQAAHPNRKLPRWWDVPRDDLELLKAAHRRGFYGASRKGPGEALLTDPAAPFLQRFRARVPLFFPCH